MRISKNKVALAGMFVMMYCVLTSSMLKKTTNGHPGSTGAPGELTCAQSGCHTDATVVAGTAVNTFTFGNGLSQYVPGTTYTVSVMTTKSGISKFGFEATSLKSSDNSFTGTFIVTDGNRTQIENGINPNPTRKYMTHKTNGTPGTGGANTWTFNWKAPSTNVGPVVFYYSTNCTNSNNASTGDKIYLSSYTVTPSMVGIEESAEKRDFNMIAFADSKRDILTINYELETASNVAVFVYDLTGRIVGTKSQMFTQAGNNQELVSLKDLKSGIYVVNMIVNDQSVVKKLFID